MKLYDRVEEGTFLSRPNRFIAMVDIDGSTVRCHVKNTMQCNELLNRGRIPEWCCSMAKKE